MTDKETMERVLKEHVIQWNKQQFFRAIGQERFDDARRFKENIEALEKTGAE